MTVQNQERLLATGITNKVGKDLYYLVLDYDTKDYAAVTSDIGILQTNCGLSEATVYETHSGYHAHFFYDNRLTKERIDEILATSNVIDKKFIAGWNERTAKGEGVTIRLSGKYDSPDLRYIQEISGSREPTLMEKSIGISLKLSVMQLVQAPLLPLGASLPKTRGETDAEETKPVADTAKKAMPIPEAPQVKPIINQAPVSAKEVEDVFSEKYVGPQGVTKMAATAKEHGEDRKKPPFDWTKKSMVEFAVDCGFAEGDYEKIKELKKRWYEWNISNTVARLISAASERREFAFQVPHEYRKDGKPTDFFDVRPVFLSNHQSQSVMLKPYEYARQYSHDSVYPYNLFQGHAKVDIGKVKIHPLGSAEYKKFQEEFRTNIHEYITDMDLVIDIDSKNVNSTEAYDDTRKVCEFLGAHAIPYSVTFSGSKGFHVRISSSMISEAVPEFQEFLRGSGNAVAFHQAVFAFAESLGAVADRKAYDGGIRSQIRCPWTVHQNTGSVVKPLTEAEFNCLEGKTLGEIRLLYRVDNLLKGNSSIWAEKINFQRKEFNVYFPVAEGESLSFEEMQQMGEYQSVGADGEPLWKEYRSKRNEIAKELRKLEAKDLAKILEFWIYEHPVLCPLGVAVKAPEYIDLVTGRNYDYHRGGSWKALREFVLHLMKMAATAKEYGEESVKF